MELLLTIQAGVNFSTISAYKTLINRAEKAICPFVIGRKNRLFSQTPKGASASADMYSLVEPAKANGLDVFEYLSWLFR